MQREQALRELAAIIEANPNCEFQIDNDCWYIVIPNPAYDGSNDDIEPTIEIASHSKYSWESEWYNWSNNYGEGLAEVLIFLLNKRGFNITAGAV